MDTTEVLKAVATVVVALIAAMVAIWTWYRQRAADRRKQQEEQSTRYVTPFVFAVEDLQSRLYDIVRLHPEEVLDGLPSYRAFATETLYLVAQYFYYEALVLQYTPLGRDPQLIPRVQAIRKTFAALLHEAKSVLTMDQTAGQAPQAPLRTVTNRAYGRPGRGFWVGKWISSGGPIA